MGLDNLKIFIENRGSAGEWDSEGSFTVAQESQESKLAQQWENAAQATLRLIQLGIAGGSTRTAVKVGKDRVNLEFRFPKKMTPEMASIDSPFRPCFRYLLDDGSPQIEILEANNKLTLTSTAEENKSAQSKSKACIVAVSLAKPKGIWNRLFSNTKARGEVVQLLAERLPFSRVSLDGRFLSEQNMEAFESTDYHQALTLLGGQESQPDALEVGKLGYYSQARESFNLRKSANPAFFGVGGWKDQSTSPVLAQLYRPKNSGEHQLYFVKNGVLVGLIEFPLYGVVSAAMLDTDASGLRLVANSKLESFLGYLHQCGQQFLSS